MDTDCKIVLCCFHKSYSVVSVIPKEGLVGPHPSILLWYDNDKDLKARFPTTQLMYGNYIDTDVYLVHQIQAHGFYSESPSIVSWPLDSVDKMG